MSLDSLPEAQRILWPRLSETPPEFVLYGGTAIALRLRHRESVDFDFFSTSPFSPEELPSAIPYLREAPVVQIAKNTFSNFNPLLTLKALSYYGEKDLQSLPRPVRDRLSLAVAGIDVGDIPYFRSRSGILRNEHHG